MVLSQRSRARRGERQEGDVLCSEQPGGPWRGRKPLILEELGAAYSQ